jgi:hypothetical protein
VSSTALVRYRGNDYSTPTSHGFQDVLVKGFVEEVVILCRGEEIARHGRSYGQGVFVYDPLHYLALIETKPNALDQAAALQGWDLPEGFQHLRHLCWVNPSRLYSLSRSRVFGLVGTPPCIARSPLR